MADIELVIKIPEIEYEHIRSQEKFCSLTKSKQEWLIDRTLWRVAEGEVLPKGHGRLGDLDELMNRIGLEDNADNREDNVGEIVTLEDIDSVVTIVEADK